MLSSISPLGERARASRWWVTTTAYLLGSVLGGLALGLLASVVGSLVPSSWRSSSTGLGVVGLLLLVGLLLDIGPGRLRLPTWRRQVAEGWLGEYRGWVIGLGFGTQLGFGLVTIITSATTYAVAVLAVLSGDPLSGLAIGGVFGLVRALPAAMMGRVDTPAALHRVFGLVEQWARPVDVTARSCLALAGGVLVVAALGGG